MRLTIVQVDTDSGSGLMADGNSDDADGPKKAKVLRFISNRRPPNRSFCHDGPRPCPYVSCRYHLYLDVRGDGVMRLNFPDRDPEELMASCALDMAEDGPRTLDSIAALMGMSKERARQLEASALVKLRVALADPTEPPKYDPIDYAGDDPDDG